MLGGAGAEAIAGQGIAAGQQLEPLVRHHDVQKSGHRADRAIAIDRRHRGLGQVRRKPHRPAMTATMDDHGSRLAAPAAKERARTSRSAPRPEGWRLSIFSASAGGDARRRATLSRWATSPAAVCSRQAGSRSSLRGRRGKPSRRPRARPGQGAGRAFAARPARQIEIGGVDDAGRGPWLRRLRGRGGDGGDGQSEKRDGLHGRSPCSIPKNRERPSIYAGKSALISNEFVLSFCIMQNAQDAGSG